MPGKSPTLMFGLLLMTVSLVVMGVGVFNMQQRLGDRDLEMVYFQEPIHLESFLYEGEPVELTVLSPEDAAEASQQTVSPEGGARLPERPEGAWVLRYSYRGETVDFPILDPADARLFPRSTDADRMGLLEDWFKVLPMVTGATTALDAAERVASGELRGRLVLAARYESPELKEQWADVQRQNWIYRMAELHGPAREGAAPDDAANADAGPAITVVEKTYAELDVLHTPGRRTPPEMIPTPDERSRDLWQHYAMQEVTPAPFFRAKDRNLDAALEAMGWTWPVSLGGGFGAVTAVILIGLGLKSKPELAA
jgi:hypothetical protein